MKLRKIAVCIACLMVVILGVAMICGGCKKNDTPDWDYTGTVSGSQNTEETTLPEDTGSAPTKTPTPAGPDDVAPTINAEVTDREELPPATNSGGSESNDSGDSTGSDSDSSTATTPGGSAATTPDGDITQFDENGNWTYEYYISRTGEEQMAYYRTFPSMSDFNLWYNNAKKAYDEAHPKETIGPDGNIDLNG